MEVYELRLTWRMLLLIIKILVLLASKVKSISQMEISYLYIEMRELETLANARITAMEK